MSSPTSPEEIRRKMRESFDAVNTEAEKTKARRSAGSPEPPEKLGGPEAETETHEDSGSSSTSSPDA